MIKCYGIINNVVTNSTKNDNFLYEPLAQSVEHLTFNQRVEGSSPSWLTILSKKNPFVWIIIWPLGQAVKTPPFHGGNTGSNPVGVTLLHI